MRFILLLLIACGAPAFAGDILLKIVDQNGRPVADAVATAKPAAGLPKQSIRFPWPYQVMQQNIAFNPHVLIVPVGATVAFPNKDNVRHHVYSFSKPARFELKLYSHDETRSYTFLSPGAVALGCNIHDAMSGFVKVVDTPFAGKSNAVGEVRLSGLPSGPVAIAIWHPLAHARDNEIALTMAADAAGTLTRTVPLTLRADQ